MPIGRDRLCEVAILTCRFDRREEVVVLASTHLQLSAHNAAESLREGSNEYGGTQFVEHLLVVGSVGGIRPVSIDQVTMRLQCVSAIL